MAFLGIDVGATKIASAVFTETGKMSFLEKLSLNGTNGPEAGALITGQIVKYLGGDVLNNDKIEAVGICVPGIYNRNTGNVWAPNIPGWNNYPFAEEVKKVAGSIPVCIESDRACYILGETWQGNASGCSNAIFMGVGTGIGAGILADGRILRGNGDIAGALGWMALCRPFKAPFKSCGCFESLASGEGIASVARELLNNQPEYIGELRNKPVETITATDVFEAFEKNDALAKRVKEELVVYWGMGVANLVSLFNPEKLLLGGGVFGPAIKFIPDIREEAAKWAQPVSMKQVSIEASALGGLAGVTGAAFLAVHHTNNVRHCSNDQIRL